MQPVELKAMLGQEWLRALQNEVFMKLETMIHHDERFANLYARNQHVRHLGLAELFVDVLISHAAAKIRIVATRAELKLDIVHRSDAEIWRDGVRTFSGEVYGRADLVGKVWYPPDRDGTPCVLEIWHRWISHPFWQCPGQMTNGEGIKSRKYRYNYEDEYDFDDDDDDE